MCSGVRHDGHQGTALGIASECCQVLWPGDRTCGHRSTAFGENAQNCDVATRCAVTRTHSLATVANVARECGVVVGNTAADTQFLAAVASLALIYQRAPQAIPARQILVEIVIGKSVLIEKRQKQLNVTAFFPGNDALTDETLPVWIKFIGSHPEQLTYLAYAA